MILPVSVFWFVEPPSSSPGRFGWNSLHAASAFLNDSLFGSTPPPLVPSMRMPPSSLGSGKSGTPFSRMHCENLRIRSCISGSAFIGSPPLGMNCLHFSWAASTLALSVPSGIIIEIPPPSICGIGMSTPLSRMHWAYLSMFSWSLTGSGLLFPVPALALAVGVPPALATPLPSLGSAASGDGGTEDEQQAEHEGCPDAHHGVFLLAGRAFAGHCAEVKPGRASPGRNRKC